MNKKTLVTYFSASGTTAGVAKKLAGALGSDIYEITPQQPYTSADLNWNNKNSRSSIEMNDPDCRPAIKGNIPDIESYDSIFVGFPIWWYVAPRIINTFLESANFTGKKIIPFATSGGSGMGVTNTMLESSCPGATLLQGKVLRESFSESGLKTWAESLI